MVLWSSQYGSVVKNPTNIHEDVGSIPGLTQRGKDPCPKLSVGHRCSPDLALQWLWPRLAAAAPIPTLAWELLRAAPEKKKKKGSPSLVSTRKYY